MYSFNPEAGEVILRTRSGTNLANTFIPELERGTIDNS